MIIDYSFKEQEVTYTIKGKVLPKSLVISGVLPNMNDYTEAQRTNKYKGARMKKDAQDLVHWHILSQIRSLRIDKPVFMVYHFYEADRKRDHDNVSAFAHKVVQDALVQAKILKNDGWKDIVGYQDLFFVTANQPYIEVFFIEIGEEL